jgi:hypothetical protein
MLVRYKRQTPSAHCEVSAPQAYELFAVICDGRTSQRKTDRIMADDQVPRRGGAHEPPPGSARSGDFSKDPAFEADKGFEVIARADNAERVSEAMRVFLKRGDLPAFERAVAVYVRSARAVGAPVQEVLGTLARVANSHEGTPTAQSIREPTELRDAVLRGVLLAFYGAEAVSGERAPPDARRGTARGARQDIGNHFGDEEERGHT